MRPLVFVSALLALILAACASGSQPEDPERLTGPGLYIALGDSLSEGVGASDREATGFVPLVHKGLGERWQLINFGRSGDTSDDLLSRGFLDATIALIQYRNGDDDPDNDAKLVTLGFGGNDLLAMFDALVLSGTCPSVEESLAKPECVDSLRETLDRFGPNLAIALDRLVEAGPDVHIVVMTLYNPISGFSGLLGVEDMAQVVEMALEGLPDTPFPEGLNDIIRGEVEERGLILVDWHPLFEGKANEYIAGDFIHPNDTGYEVMAAAILETVR
jgi:lysophospholipase L1-like esterase